MSTIISLAVIFLLTSVDGAILTVLPPKKSSDVLELFRAPVMLNVLSLASVVNPVASPDAFRVTVFAAYAEKLVSESVPLTFVGTVIFLPSSARFAAFTSALDSKVISPPSDESSPKVAALVPSTKCPNAVPSIFVFNPERMRLSAFMDAPL